MCHDGLQDAVFMPTGFGEETDTSSNLRTVRKRRRNIAATLAAVGACLRPELEGTPRVVSGRALLLFFMVAKTETRGRVASSKSARASNLSKDILL